MAIYSKGKRAKMRHKSKLITLFLILIVIACLIYLFVSNSDLVLGKNNENMTNEEEGNQITENIVANEMMQNEIKEDEIADVEIPKKIGSYKVVGQIVMEQFGETKNVIGTCNETSLNVSPAQQYGPSINQPGNVVICGHNWDSMFEHLSELEKGDTFYMINSETKVKYKVDYVSVNDPSNKSCLRQNQDEKREVTLYTCTPGRTPKSRMQSL